MYVGEIVGRYGKKRYFSSLVEQEVKDWINQEYVEEDQQAVIWYGKQQVYIA